LQKQSCKENNRSNLVAGFKENNKAATIDESYLT